MGLLEIIIMSIGLAMDAFSVSICKGLSIKKYKFKNSIIIGLYFGLFHMIMPIIGYYLGSSFEKLITSIDHWVAFILLFLIGSHMIKESLSKERKKADGSIKFNSMFPLAVATSIDTLAVGITLAFLKANVYLTSIIIGVVTFIFSIIGVKIGNTFGIKYEKKAKLFGGIILIIIGVKILIEHLY